MANGHKPEKFEQFNSAHVFDVARYLKLQRLQSPIPCVYTCVRFQCNSSLILVFFVLFSVKFCLKII